MPIPEEAVALMVLLDHANIPFDRVSLLHIVRTWLDSLSDNSELTLGGVVTVHIRAYGGWYLGDRATDARYEAAEFYQRTCPSVFMNAGRYFRVTFEFADYQILLAPGADSSGRLRVTHTVAARSSPVYLASTPVNPCTESDCEITAVRHWMRHRRACTKAHCPRAFSDFFRRLEQKQVDVHMALDLYNYAIREGEASCLAIASDDVDLVPALVAAAAQRRDNCHLSLLRFATGIGYADGFLTARGVQLVRVP